MSKIKTTGIAALAFVAAIVSVALSIAGYAGGASSYTKLYAGEFGRCVWEQVVLCKSSGQYADPNICTSTQKMSRFRRKCYKMGRKDRLKMK